MTSKQFKQKRLDLGLTQVQLAESLDLSDVHIGRLENGHKVSRAIELAINSLVKK